MFRELNTIFEKRKILVNINKDKYLTIKNHLTTFLKEEFKNDITNLSFVVNFNHKNNTLTIITSNKIIANELTLRLDSLMSYLKNKKIKLEGILIR